VRCARPSCANGDVGVVPTNWRPSLTSTCARCRHVLLVGHTQAIVVHLWPGNKPSAFTSQSSDEQVVSSEAMHEAAVSTKKYEPIPSATVSRLQCRP